MIAFLLAIVLDYRLMTPDYRLCDAGGAAPVPAIAEKLQGTEKANCANGQCSRSPVVRWRLIPRGRR